MKILKRRSFLKACGAGAAAGLFAPLLRRAWAEDPATAMPRRFVFFVEGNGVFPHTFFDPVTQASLDAKAGTPVKWNRDYKHDETIVNTNAPLSGARALASLGQDMHDLESRAAVVLGLSSKVAGGGHTTTFGALSARRVVRGAPGETIDHYLSSRLNAGKPFDAVRLGIASHSGEFNRSVCAAGKGKALPVLLDPRQAFDHHFSALFPSSGTEFVRKGQLLDFAREDANLTLQSFSGNSRERAKVESYLEALERANTQHRLLGESSAMGGSLYNAATSYGLLQPGESATPYNATSPLERLEAQAEIATVALIGELTNVVVMTCGAGNDWPMSYPSLASFYPDGEVYDSHDMRHDAGQGTSRSSTQVELLSEVTSRQIAVMAKMARKLADTPEVGGVGGSMLDHTVFVYTSDNGEKHHSEAEEWPILLIGGDKLGLHTDGRAIVFPRVGRDKNMTMANLFSTLAYSANEPTDVFGDETTAERLTKGPLGELMR